MSPDDETPQRSPYWLSPDVDVPTREEWMPGMRSAKGLFFFSEDGGEGAFIPTPAFMSHSPVWRLDVLGDITLDIQRTQRHAVVELFRNLSRKVPDATFERRLSAIQTVFKQLGLVMTEDLEELLIRDHRFTSRVLELIGAAR